VRLLAATLVVICGFGVMAARAYEAVPQPLTRAGCDQAHLKWDDTANVCTSAVDLAVTPASTGQPLSRRECDLAGMPWSDVANVCDGGAEGGTSQVAAAAAEILIDIDKAKQTMVVSVDGVTKYTWPVSTGRPGYATPSGDFTARSMNKIWYSKQWDNAPMPHAIFFTKDGHAVHGSYDVKHLGQPASHGCVRISPQNAETLYDLVAENGLDHTEVVLVGSTPGGDTVAPQTTASAKSRARPLVAADDVDVQPQRRGGGFFKRLFGRRQQDQGTTP
jgi:lipoprotein-anchoring transpeptidase ErfK/SrfK